MATTFPLLDFEALNPASEPVANDDWDSFKAEFVATGDTITDWHLALWNARVGMVLSSSTSFIEVGGIPPVLLP